ncbi:iron complex transport system permease protein [Marinococcus luteus]|uniref:Iron complex transport system permease protein n=1 Tax=Marinococcus luteus TaxID=1122204 RepID=A0A1H2RL02_9BACI|nr:iron ABC transporter permease [Marinococcus luteus]SDW19434.1 iron complex transport system permease protein [Marinococcus luteus]
MKRHTTWRTRFFSVQMDMRAIRRMGLLVLAVLAACLLGPSLGNTMLSPVTVVETMMGSGSGANEFIVNNSRVPRTLVALLTGGALGVSGLLLQGVVRNPLAAPDIVGVTGGASVAAVAFMTFGAGAVSIQWIPLAAISGALLVSTLIYALAWKKGVSPIRLILIGIGISAIMSAAVTFMIIVSSAVTATDAYVWLTGSIYGASWSDIFTIAPVIALGLPLAVVFSSSLNAQQLGDDTSAGLGVRIQVDRIVVVFLSVVLAGTAVAVAGAIGFIGLIAPHIARALIGRSYGALVPASACTGAILLFAADLIARTIFYPVDVPAGVFTAAIGAPFFLYLLFRNRNHF